MNFAAWLEARIERNPITGCWKWIGKRDQRGYGRCFGMALAHRVVWEILKGDPGELYLLHQCDNPPCVNPEHLKLGTQADNMQDAARKGRMPRGLAHWNAKLAPSQVDAIRQANGTHTQIAREFGVCQSYVSQNKSGKKRRV